MLDINFPPLKFTLVLNGTEPWVYRPSACDVGELVCQEETPSEADKKEADHRR